VPKILVADDNTNIQKMVSLAFEERGIDVVAVGNGEAAVRRIPDMNPDLVLADIFMPVRNGYEVCEFVKKDERFSHIPVILLVGAFDPLDEKEARRVGADGVLKKPFVPPDPLIAMVISALEKNPKVAAEMAKAREVVPEPAPQPILPALEMPARAEIKPLPEFPEPSPEEAALVYGFGSGKRGNEGAAEAKGPVSPEIEEEEAEEEESDATSHDWRRNAMDFEIPEETSKTTAFALDDDADTAMFPSEKDVPPKHVRAKTPMPLVDTEAAARIASATAFVPPAPPPSAKPPIPVQASWPKSIISDLPRVEPNDSLNDSNAGMTATMWGAAPPVLPTAPASPFAPPPAASVTPAPLPEVKPALSKLSALWSAKPPVVEPVVEAVVEVVEDVSKIESVEHAPVMEVEEASEPAFAAPGAHWMDAVTASQKEPEVVQPEATLTKRSDPAPPVKMDLDPPAEAPQPVSVTPVASEPQRPSVPEELSVTPEPLQPEDEDTFFADENDGASDWLPVVSADSNKKRVPAEDPALEQSGPVPVSHLAADPELIAEPEESGPIAKDPALVEPPAVRVTPEPLLVDETPEPASSRYDKREEPTAPAFTFKVPEPTADETVEMNASAEAQDFADKRVPTMPPPNREVLAEIPFLTPPPEFLAEKTQEQESNGSDIDAVVQKVLEKLEPQLHNLLSQGLLKPLVENILQNETAKKSR
jgi:CheY-like chemotaxis protein